MPYRDKVLFIVGLCITISSFLLTSFYAIGVSLEPEDYLFTNILTIILLGVIPITFGTILIARTVKREKLRQKERLENEILKLVTRLKGKITIAELAKDTRLTIEEAEKKLEYYVKIGVAERLISERGVFVYHFPSVLSKEDKKQSQSLYEI